MAPKGFWTTGVHLGPTQMFIGKTDERRKKAVNKRR